MIASFIFLATIVITSRLFYMLELKRYTKKVVKKVGLDIIHLDYSFEQMVYFISLPSSSPWITDASKDNISIEYDYQSFTFPDLLGVKIFIKTPMEKRMLAYLPIKAFRLPSLDQILEQGKITDSDYRKISTYKLTHLSTLNEIKEEVYKQIQVSQGTVI